jgi:hypothetical protein
VSRVVRGALLALSVTACGAPQKPSDNHPIPTATSVAELAAAIAEDAKRSDRATDAKTRGDLAADASAQAAACLDRDPQQVACLYGHAVALGLEARAHPTQADKRLNAMLGALGSAEAADAGYDEAGPARVRALVLVRSPGWPLGPGDTEEGLIAARRAVQLRPQYPPNQLALGEALRNSGDATGAHDSYTHARDLALALPDTPDRAVWLREADEALRRP